MTNKYKDYYTLAELWNKSKANTLLYAKYREEIESEYKWNRIISELDARFEEYLMNEYEVKTWDEDPCYGIFVGTVFNMTPSGKYYLPFACSNVTIKEALKDEIFWSAMEDVLEEKELFHQSGEGDPCDVFFCKCLDRLDDEEEDVSEEE